MTEPDKTGQDRTAQEVDPLFQCYVVGCSYMAWHEHAGAQLCPEHHALLTSTDRDVDVVIDIPSLANYAAAVADDHEDEPEYEPYWQVRNKAWEDYEVQLADFLREKFTEPNINFAALAVVISRMAPEYCPYDCSRCAE